jgi:UPF0716 family protein affecting phage T7 exclusion
MKLGKSLAFVVLPSLIHATSLFAQTTRGAVSVRYAVLSPFIAVLAGVLILIIPRLLSYIVALYLILSGLIGIFGR